MSSPAGPPRERAEPVSTPPDPVPGASRKGRPCVLLDTNALFLPFTRRFPLEREILRIVEGAHIEVPQSVLGELDRLVARARPNARAARAYAERFPVVKTDLKGDAAIETLARDLGAIIVTADGELRRRLHAKGMKILFPRGERHLAYAQGPVPRRPTRERGAHRARARSAA